MRVHQVLDEVHDHIVEHQGVHHLAHAQLCFQHGGDQHHDGDAYRACQHGKNGQQHGRQGHVDGDHGGNEGSQHDAALSAQVELVGGEHDAGGKTGEHDGDHGRQHVAEVLDAERAGILEQRTDQQLAQRIHGQAEFGRHAVGVGGDKDQQHCHQQRDGDRRGAADDGEHEVSPSGELQISFITHGRPSGFPRLSAASDPACIRP